MTRRLVGAGVRVGSAMAWAGAAHSIVNARVLRTPTLGARPRARYSILVPARDEASTIAECVHALRGPAPVIVLDDESADATAECARAAGARVVAGDPVPPGWLGKPWACEQLVRAADPRSEILVFVDADVVIAPGGVAAAVALLETSGLDIVCPFPRQLALTTSERLVQPLLQWSWLTTLPLRLAEHDRFASLTAACGQFLVVRRTALERAGGFAAVRASVLDDVALVRAVKAAGGRGGVVDGSGVATCRMYTGWPDLRDGYAKSLWSVAGTSTGTAAVVGVLTLGWVLPAVAALRGSRVGLGGYAAGVLSRVVTAKRTGGRAGPDAFAHPASILLLDWLMIRSSRLRRRGRLRWKGRLLGPGAQ